MRCLLAALSLSVGLITATASAQYEGASLGTLEVPMGYAVKHETTTPPSYFLRNLRAIRDLEDDSPRYY